MYDLIPNKSKPKRSGKWPFRIAGILTVLVFILVVSALLMTSPTLKPIKPESIGLSSIPVPTATPACKDEIAYYKDKSLKPLMEEWIDAFNLAKSSPRIALAPSIASMQEIHRRIKAIEPSTCALPTHLLFVEATESVIDGFLAFMANEPTLIVEQHFTHANELLDIINKE